MIPERIRLTAITIARTFMGVEENPRGSNDGFSIDMMKQKFGGKDGWSWWCMYFVQYCYWEAHKIHMCESPLPFRNADGTIDLSEPNGHCYSVWHRASAEPRLTVTLTPSIQMGYIIPMGSVYVHYKADHTGHTGIVVSHWRDDGDHNRDIIKTIEGNTSNEVGLRTYTLASMMGRNLKGVIN